MGTKVEGSFKNLLQGVSQQPPRDRVDGSCTEQINMTSDPVKSLSSINPTYFQLSLDRVFGDVKFIDIIYKEKLYNLICSTNSIEVWNRTDAVQLSNVTTQSVTDYLDKNMAATTYKDDVILANKTTPVYMNEAVVKESPNGAVVYCRGGTQDYNYSVNVNGIKVTFTPSNNTEASGANIINEISLALSANLDPSIYEIYAIDNVMWVKKLTDGAIIISTEDEVGGDDLVLVLDVIDDSSKLPAYAPNGYTMTITKTDDAYTDDYYMEYYIENPSGVQPADDFGDTGYWRECAKAGILTEYDLSTMPLVLHIDDTLNEFSLAEGEWFPRSVGDDDTNPLPSFVGSTINNLTVFQGRLVFLSDTVVMSRTNKPYEFYKKSATLLADDDVIDITSNATGGMYLSAVQHNKALSITTNDHQFIMPGDIGITPKNKPLTVSSSFNISPTTDPITTGKSLLLPFTHGSYGGIMEIFPSLDASSTEGSNLTKSISRYIDGDIKVLAPSSNFGKVFILADKAYIYEYLWNGQTKLQSSFSKLDYGDFTVRHFSVYNDELFIVLDKDGKTFFSKMLMDQPDDEDLDYTVYLHNKVKVEAVHSEITIPYLYDENLLFIGGGNISKYAGLELDVVSYVNNVNGTCTVTLENGLDGDVYVGWGIYSSYVPTEPVIKDKNGVPIDTARFRIQKYTTAFEDTGPVKYTITNTNNPSDTYTGDLNIQKFDDIVSFYDTLVLSNDTTPVSIKRDPKKFTIDYWRNGYVPMNILDITYTGVFTPRGRRL